MKKIALLALAAVILTGCQNRTIWNDSGKLEEATRDREVWDTRGKIDTDERKIWHDSQGNPIIK